MKNLIIYDSTYGNTEMVARTIAKTLDSEAIEVRNVHLRDLEEAELVIVGSPTQGGRPTIPIQMFLKRLYPYVLKNVSIAAFDTRFKKNTHGLFLRIVIHIIGFAAPRIQKLLELKGGRRIVEAEGFIVKDKEGPLEKGELNRAKKWAETIRHAQLA